MFTQIDYLTEAVRRVSVRYNRPIAVQYVETPAPFFDGLKNALEARTADIAWTRIGTNVPERALAVDFSCNYFTSRNALYSSTIAKGGKTLLADVPVDAEIGCIASFCTVALPVATWTRKSFTTLQDLVNAVNTGAVKFALGNLEQVAFFYINTQTIPM